MNRDKLYWKKGIIQSLKNNESDKVNECKGAAERLARVISWMRNNGHSRTLLHDFAHSATCFALPCTSFCRMFRRIRRHVVITRHPYPCSLLKIYALLLKLHVKFCTRAVCGLPSCKFLQARERLKRSSA